MPKPKKRRLQLKRKRKQSKRKTNFGTNLFVESGFALHNKKVYKIFSELLPEIRRIGRNKSPPSPKQVQEINSAVKQLKKHYNVLFALSLKLEPALRKANIGQKTLVKGKTEMDLFRHKLQTEFIGVKRWFELIEDKFEGIGLEKLET